MGRHITYITLILSWAWVANAHAQQVATTITRTAGAGDLGTKVSRAGNGFDINGGTRPSNGRNLFHSFDQFSLGRGDIANFANDTGLATQNILSRVTGGSRSDIFGTIKTTGFPGAGLFLLNPHGIVFGANAELDLQGSFHASTGDFIRLSDEVKFNALPSGQDALLSTAPPSAFGFLEDHPAPIEVNHSFLTVPDGKTLSLVGGDITMKNGTVYAPGGQINLISTASPGEVAPTLSSPKLEANVTSTALGKITLSRDAISDTGIGDVDVGGAGGGAVVIRGGEFVLEGASVLAQTFEDTKGVGIDIRVGSLDMHSFDQGMPASIDTTTFGGRNGDGGDVFVEADTMRLSGAFPTGILAQAEGDGNAGNIKIKTRLMNVEKGATVSSATFSQGKGGNLDIDADSIMLDGGGSFITTQSAPFFSASAGNAGNIDIKTNGLTLISGAQIRSLTAGPGRAGDISIQAERIFLSGGSSITSQQSPIDGIGAGDAGHINVTTKLLEVRDGANINALTAGIGKGGNMSVTAEDILLVGDPSILFTGLSNETQNDGNAGNLTVTANRLEIRDNARIEASTLFDKKLTGAGRFSGKGGNLTVTANDIFISGEGAGIVAKSTNRNPAATSGDIHVIANDSLRIENQGTISVETVLADAGDITLDVGFLLHLREQSSITTSVAPGPDGKGTGNGGDINIDPIFTVLDGGSQIIANALEGSAGNIFIRTDFLFRSPDSEIEASNRFGVEGNVEIDSPDTDVISGALELPESFLDAATLLTQGCAAGADLSRLVVRKYEVLPDSPAALRVPPPGGLLNADAQDAGFALTRETLGLGFERSSGCDGDG